MAVSRGLRRRFGFAFRLDRQCVVDFRAARSGGFVLWCCFSLNRSFSGRDSVQLCEIPAGIHVVRSVEFLLRLGFAQPLRTQLVFRPEDLS